MVNFSYYFTVKKQQQQAIYSIYEAAVKFLNHRLQLCNGHPNNVYRLTTSRLEVIMNTRFNFTMNICKINIL